MEDSAKHVGPIRIVLPPFRGRREFAWGIAIAVAIVDFLFFAGIGLTHIYTNLALFVLMQVFFIGLMLFPFWLTYSHLLRVTLEMSQHSIRLVPGSMNRALIGTTAEELALPSQAAEVLLCQMFVPRKLDTYRVIVRAGDGSERWIGGKEVYTRVALRPADLEALTDALRSATGLPVRTAIRRQAQDGSVEETPWEPTKPHRGLGAVAFLVLMLPFAGGIIMGILSPNPAIVIAVGLTLWLCLMLALIALWRADPARKKSQLLYALTTLISFSATYAVCFLVTAYMSHPN